MRLIPLSSLDGKTSVTQVTQTGTLTSASAVVTGLSNTLALKGACGISGVGIPDYTYVNSIDSASQVTLSQAATASGAESLTFVLEPISVPEAKAAARVEIPDDDPAAVMNNFLIATYIQSARIECESTCRQALLAQQWTLFLDSFPSAGGYYNRAIREIWPSLGSLPSGLGFYPGLIPNSTGVIDIPLPPLRSVDSVQYVNNAGVLTTVAPAAYNASLGDVGRIQPQYSTVWPISRPTIDSVQITFTAGMGPTSASVPANLKAGIMMLVAHFYENREAVQAEGNFVVMPLGVLSLWGATDPGIYA